MKDEQAQLHRSLAADLGARLEAMQCRVACVESCTGGGLAHVITAISGSSRWFERGFVTYSNDAKTEMVGVPGELIETCGAVSVEVATAMAKGGLRFSKADCAISITGVAGPDGGTDSNPVGTVCFAWARAAARGQPRTRTERTHFPGERHAVREQSITHALTGLLDLLNEGEGGGNG